MGSCDNPLLDLIFYHFEDDEDSFFAWATTMFGSFDPPQILGHVSHLKSEGNTLYKENNYGGASEKYGLAIKLCSVILSEEEVGIPSISELVISLNLNLAACALKNHDCVRAGQICSLVLQVDPRNVKALFRRAIAALELHKPDLAYLDLVKALDIDSTNKEVENKLLEVKRVLGLPSVGKRKCDLPESAELLTREKKIPCFEEGVCEVVRKLSKDSVHDIVSEQRVSEVEISNAGIQSNLSEDSGEMCVHPSPHCCDEDSTVGMSPPVSDHKKSNLAEPKFRFSSRHRRGSFLHISQATYNRLLKGDEIAFINANQFSVLKVRILGQEKDPKDAAEVIETPSLYTSEGTDEGSCVTTVCMDDVSYTQKENTDLSLEQEVSSIPYSFSSKNSTPRARWRNVKQKLVKPQRRATTTRGKKFVCSNKFCLRKCSSSCRFHLGKRKSDSRLLGSFNINQAPVKRKRVDLCTWDSCTGIFAPPLDSHIEMQALENGGFCRVVASSKGA